MVNVPVKGKATELDITDEMRAACESIVPADLRDHDGPAGARRARVPAQVRNNVILAGGRRSFRGCPT